MRCVADEGMGKGATHSLSSNQAPEYYFETIWQTNFGILQVSLKLQDQLGLAMVKYQRGRLHDLHFA